MVPGPDGWASFEDPFPRWELVADEEAVAEAGY